MITLWQQLSTLFETPAGNFVYHLVTLFTLQVTFALAVAQWRRTPHNSANRQLAIGAGTLLVTRFTLLILTTIIATFTDPLASARYLPPLTQLANAITTIIILWLLIPPHPQHKQQTRNIIISTITISILLYLFTSPRWHQIASIQQDYLKTGSALGWFIYQITLLSAGIYFILPSKQQDKILRLTLLITLLTAYLFTIWLHWFQTTTTPLITWVRFAYLIIFPLLATLAHRQTIQQLLSSDPQTVSPQQTTPLWRHVSQILATDDYAQLLKRITTMTASAMPVSFAAVAAPHPTKRHYLLIVCQAMPLENHTTYEKELNLDDWPALLLAMSQKKSVDLQLMGIGAQQLKALYHTLDIEPIGPMHIEPLIANDRTAGLLLLSYQTEEQTWSLNHRQQIIAIADFAAQAIRQKRTPQTTTSTTSTTKNKEVTTIIRERDKALAAQATQNAHIQMLKQQITELEELLIEEKERGNGAEIRHAQNHHRYQQLQKEWQLLQQAMIKQLGPPSGQKEYTAADISAALTAPAAQPSPTTPKTNNGHHSPPPTTIDQIITSVRHQISTLLAAKKLEFNMDISPHLPPIADEKEPLIKMIIGRLLENAAIATPAHGQLALIIRPHQTNPHQLLISVADSGGGITPEDQKQIFNRQYRQQKPFIAGFGDHSPEFFEMYDQIQANGGRIWLSSKSDIGSSFSVLIPVTNTEEQHAQ
ncbi:MAG TPA: ATP-binding protein [Anaerolineae bacterium]|nr:ATP-binding protein [Anaerolineae bacterium]